MSINDTEKLHGIITSVVYQCVKKMQLLSTNIVAQWLTRFNCEEIDKKKKNAVITVNVFLFLRLTEIKHIVQPRCQDKNFAVIFSTGYRLCTVLAL